MSKFIIIPFSNETDAFKGVQMLKDLDRDGDIGLYAYSVLAKSVEGRLAVKKMQDEGQPGLVFGSLIGGLVGMFGGPAGLALGVAGGALLGSLADIAKAGAPMRFAEAVAREIEPGGVAIVAEIDEGWTTPLDASLQTLGTAAIREWRSDVEDAQYEADAKKARQEYEHLKDEANKTHEANKAKLREKAQAAKSYLTATRDAVKTRLDTIKAEADAKIAHAQQQLKTASAERKAQIETRIAEIKTDAHQRSEKLHQAWELTKEALR